MGADVPSWAGRALRWTVASAVAGVTFLFVWWWCDTRDLPLVDLPADADTRSQVSVTVAGAVSAIVLALLAWWASRERRAETAAVAGVPGPQFHGTVGNVYLGAAPTPATVPLPVPPVVDRQSVVEQAKAALPVRYGEMPREPVAFQPRTDLVDRLRRHGERGGVAVVCAVTGLPGVGKTQVAAAYARQRRDEGWPLVAWIAADGADKLLAGLDQLAERLGIRRPQDGSASAAARVRAALEELDGPSLVVFDNAVDPAHLTRWLPSAGRAQVVITSTQHAFENVGTPVEVDLFSPDETVRYLADRTGLGDPAGAAAVGEELGRLPVALAQAAAVIRRERLSYATYLRRLRTLSIGDYLVPVPGDPYPKSAAEAILLALRDAESVGGELARRLLDLLAVLSPDGVSREFLHEGANLLADRLTDADLDRLLGRLRDASLVVVSVDGGTVALHRLIQRVLRDRAARDGTLEAMVDCAARFLTTARPDDARTIATRDRCEQIVEHSTALWDTTNRLEADQARSVLPAVLGCRLWTFDYFIYLGDTVRGIELGEAVRAACERVLGPDHPDTLTSQHNLATAYRQAGRLDEAITLHEHTLIDRQRILGPDHPDTLTSQNNLAYAYQQAGGLDEAIPLFERTLTAHRQILGPDHPDTLTSQNNLASAYRHADRLDEAIPLAERTLIDRQRILGPDHPNTLTSQNNLAGAYRQAGRLDEAVPLLERTLTAAERVLGPGHPDANVYRANLAVARAEARRGSGGRAELSP